MKSKQNHATLSIIAAACALAMPLTALAEPGQGWEGGRPGRAPAPLPARLPVALTVAAGQTQTISATTRLNALTLASGGQIVAPSGQSLTLTVNGIGTPLAAGTYRGDLVLTVTDNIDVQFTSAAPGGSPEVLNHVLRTGVYIQNGSYVAGKSVAAIVRGGQVSNTAANNVQITSNEEKFNGIIVAGLSDYSIRNPRISLTGNGGNDFAGFGAAIMSTDDSTVHVDGARIDTHGAIRTAVFAGGNSTMNVDRSSIDAHGGTLPAGYSFTVATGKMMEVPWMLGITGNNRATNVVKNATANYSNSHIRSQAWGALSTDDVNKVRLNVSNSLVETVESGYGAYSIGDCIDTFSHSVLNVADMAMIMANGPASGVFTDGTVVNSGRFGVMMHSNSGGTLTIDKGTVFRTKSTAIQAKSSSPTVVIDNARLYPGNGVLLQAVVNDDPYMAQLGFPASGSNVDATIRNTRLAGDIINGNSIAANVSVALANASLVGGISTATTTHATAANGTALSFAHPELYYLVGDFTHQFAPLASSFGMTVSLDATSSWTVGKTSYLTRLTLASGATLAAPAGHRLTMTVNGIATPIRAGASYSGAIVLAVS